MNALRTLKRTVLKHKLEKKGFRRVNRYMMRYWKKQKKG